MSLGAPSSDSVLSHLEAIYDVFLLACQTGRLDDAKEIHTRLEATIVPVIPFLDTRSSSSSGRHTRPSPAASASPSSSWSSSSSSSSIAAESCESSSGSDALLPDMQLGPSVALVDWTVTRAQRLSSKTALMYAASSSANTLDVVAWLIENGASVNRVDRESKWTSLHRAIYFGNVDIALLLIANGADITARDYTNVTPLDLVARSVPGRFRLRPEQSPLSLPLRSAWGTLANDRALGSAAPLPLSQPAEDEGLGLENLHPTAGSSDGPKKRIFAEGFPAFESLLAGADVYSWGLNSNYCLGHSTGDSRNAPDRLDVFCKSAPKINIVVAVTAKFHSAFLSDSSEVYTCGFGVGGRLGHDNEDTVVVPRKVQGPLSGKKCLYVAVGQDHTIVVCTKSEVFAFGDNSFGQLGLGHVGRPQEESQKAAPPSPSAFLPSTSSLLSPASASSASVSPGMHKTPKAGSHNQPHALPPVLSPTLIKHFKEKKVDIVGVSCAKHHTVAYSRTEIYTFGANNGQLGHPKGEAVITAPRIVSSLTRSSGSICNATASETVTACVMSSLEIFVLHGHATIKLALPQFDLPRHQLNFFVFSRRAPLRVAAGPESSVLIVTTSGAVLLWMPWMGHQFLPLEFPNQSDFRVVDVSVGLNNLVVLSEHGQVYVGKPPALEKMHTKAKSMLAASNATVLSASQLESLTFHRVPVHRVRNLHHAVAVSTDPSANHFVAVTSAYTYASLASTVSVSASQMALDMRRLLESESHFTGDTLLVPSDAETYGDIRCHRFILASRARSWLESLLPCGDGSADDIDIPTPSFATASPSSAAADGKYQSSSGNAIARYSVDSMPFHALRQWLQYLYTGTCDILEQSVSEKAKHAKQPRASETAGAKHLKVDKAKGKSKKKAAKSTTAPDSHQHQHGDEQGAGASDPLESSSLSPFEIADILMDAAKHASIPELAQLLEAKFKSSWKLAHSMAGRPPSFLDAFQALPVGSQAAEGDSAVQEGLYDVRLSFEPDKFVYAHKCVLIARCEYFSAMFASPFWMEAGADVPLLGLPCEVSYRALRAVLEYFYCDTVNLHEASDVAGSGQTNTQRQTSKPIGPSSTPQPRLSLPLAFEVLVAANVLLLDRLKELCEAEIATCIDLKNVTSFLDMASMYNCKQLQNACLEFIYRNVELILETRQLERFLPDKYVSILGQSLPPISRGHSEAESADASGYLEFFAAQQSALQAFSKGVLEDLCRAYREHLPSSRRAPIPDAVAFHAAASKLPQNSRGKAPAGRKSAPKPAATDSFWESAASAPSGKHVSGSSGGSFYASFMSSSVTPLPSEPSLAGPGEGAEDADRAFPEDAHSMSPDAKLAQLLQEQEDEAMALALMKSFEELDTESARLRVQQGKAKKKQSKAQADKSKRQAAAHQEEVERRKEIMAQTVEIEEPPAFVPPKAKAKPKGVRVDLSNPEESLKRIVEAGNARKAATASPSPSPSLSTPPAPASLGAHTLSTGVAMDEATRKPVPWTPKQSALTMPPSIPGSSNGSADATRAVASTPAPPAPTSSLKSIMEQEKSLAAKKQAPATLPSIPTSAITTAAGAPAPKIESFVPADLLLSPAAARKKMSQRERKISQSREQQQLAATPPHAGPSPPSPSSPWKHLPAPAPSSGGSNGSSGYRNAPVIPLHPRTSSVVQQSREQAALATSAFPTLSASLTPRPQGTGTGTGTGTVNFAAIQQEQLSDVTKAKAAVKQAKKAFDLIQLEEKALTQIRLFYEQFNQEAGFEEFVEIDRVLRLMNTTWYRLTHDRSDFELFGVGMFLDLLLSWFVLVIPFTLLDALDLPLLAAYKIQQKQSPSSKDKDRLLRLAVKMTLGNFVLLLLPVTLIAGPLFLPALVRKRPELPSATEVILHLAVFFVLDDIWFYIYHRTLHSVPRLYQRFHKPHHTFTAPFAFVSHATHPVEMTLQMMGSVVPLLLLRPHLFTFYVWLAVRQFAGIEDHLGYKLPWALSELLPGVGGAHFHDLHHSKNSGNFASVFSFIDVLCGTNIKAAREG